MTDGVKWPVRLSATAEADFHDIIRWTFEKFGEKQARAYADVLSSAIGALADGPRPLGAQERVDIAPGIFTLHVAREGRKGRHFVMYRVDRSGNASTIDVLRLLHDAIDLQRHLPLRVDADT